MKKWHKVILKLIRIVIVAVILGLICYFTGFLDISALKAFAISMIYISIITIIDEIKEIEKY